MSDRVRDLRDKVDPAQLAAIVGGIILLLFLVWFFVLRSSGTSTSTTPPITSAAPSPLPSPNKTPVKHHKGPIESFKVFSPKDPFKPLVDLNAGSGTSGTTSTSGSGGTTSTTTTSGTTGTTSTGTTSGTTSGTAGGTTGTTSDGSSATTTTFPSQGGSGGGKTVGGHSVKTLDVFERKGKRMAQVQVDDTVYTVAVGERFARSFKLLSVGGNCAGLLFGDEQFTACVGQQIIK